MLEMQHVTRRYMSRTAVSDLSLQLAPGKTYALLGPNGSGKTTLMKMIAGLTQPTSGELLLDGMPIGPKTKGRIAYMPTESYFYAYMSVADAGRYYADFFQDFSREKFQDMCTRMELHPKDKIRALSSGMNAKLRLTLILSRDADVMMFDEPLNGVDLLTRNQVIREIAASRGQGRTLLISTHLFEEMNDFFDEAILLRQGALVCMDTRQALEAQHGSLTKLYLQTYGGREADAHAEAAEI